MAGESFHNIQIPEKYSFESVGGEQFETDIIISASGHEQRNQNWVEARRRWDLAYRVEDRTEIAELRAFFINRKGRSRGFRFKDWADYQIDEVIGTGNGILTIFDITKTYSYLGYSDSRPIYKPYMATVEVYKAGVLQSSGFTVWDYGAFAGKVIFTSPPAGGEAIRVVGEFHVPVRFDTDSFQVSQLSSSFFSVESLPLVEVRYVPDVTSEDTPA